MCIVMVYTIHSTALTGPVKPGCPEGTEDPRDGPIKPEYHITLPLKQTTLSKCK